MPRLFITCPVTNAPVDAGFNVPLELMPSLSANHLKCACGGTHMWSGSDAYLQGQPQKPAPK